MKNKLKTAKDHVMRNKDVYLSVGVTAVVCCATTALLCRTGENVSTKVTQIGFRNEATTAVINLVERSTSSKPVHLVGTNLYFSSLSEASRETGHHLSMLSKHINGHISDLNGDVFQLLEMA